jgi:hypothetical protein
MLVKHRREVAAFLVACSEYDQNPTISQQIDDLVITSNIVSTETYDLYINLIDMYIERNDRDRSELEELRHVYTDKSNHGIFNTLWNKLFCPKESK